MSILLTIIIGAFIIGGIGILLLILFGLGTIAWFIGKVLIALGLVYMGIKLLTRILF